MFLRHLVRWPAIDIQVKFYGDRENPSDRDNTKERKAPLYVL